VRAPVSKILIHSRWRKICRQDSWLHEERRLWSLSTRQSEKFAVFLEWLVNRVFVCTLSAILAKQWLLLKDAETERSDLRLPFGCDFFIKATKKFLPKNNKTARRLQHGKSKRGRDFADLHAETIRACTRLGSLSHMRHVYFLECLGTKIEII
jgi:hypothetical protein